MPHQLISLEARFWAKVVVPLRGDGSLLPDDRQCWLWIGAKCTGRPGGCSPYGTIRVGAPSTQQKKAHVVAFFLKTGAWPVLDVCHECDTPLCCNPSHLFEASHRENMAGYVVKYGRLGIPKSEWPAPPRPKLPFTAEEVDWAERVALAQEAVVDDGLPDEPSF